MANELARPGVEVLQTFRTVSPSIITPTLPPCVVGVCRQVVDAVTSSALNSDALISLPGFILAKAATGTPKAYTTIDGDSLVLSVNGAPNVTIQFSGTSITPAAAVAQILAKFATEGVTEATAETVDDDSFIIYTTAKGDFPSLYVASTTSADIVTAFGVVKGHTYQGQGQYQECSYTVPNPFGFPDPRGNIDQLTIDPDSVHAYIALGYGAEVLEVKRTESHLRKGAGQTQATVTGTGDITAFTYNPPGPGTLDSHTFTVTIDGVDYVVTYDAATADSAEVIAKINTAIGSAGTADISGGKYVRITAASYGYNSTISFTAGVVTDALPHLGFTAGVTTHGSASVLVVDDGDGDSTSPLVQCTGALFTSAGTSAVMTGTADITAGALYGVAATLDGKTLIMSVNGGPPQTLTFDGATSSASKAAMLAAINLLWPDQTATDVGTYLTLTTTSTGEESEVAIVGGTALSALGLTLGASAIGRGYPPIYGDEFYADGVYVGKILSVAPGGTVTRLKLNVELPITSDYADSYYIIAKNLTNTKAATRPTANLTVDSHNNIILKHDLLRDTTGTRIWNARADLYVSYMAVRKDATVKATHPSLLKFSSTTDLESMLSPISVDNPLGLGLYLALLNAPSCQVTGLGVDETSADSPYGTVEAFTRAFEFLEAYDVYGIAPMTHDASVAQVGLTHVTAMSEPAAKGERIVLCNLSAPTRAADTLVASGLRGNATDPSGLVFDTGIMNLGALLLAKGVSPVGTIAASSGVFLDIASDNKNYSIASISGSQVTIRTSFTPPDNDDSFYSTTDLNDSPLPTQLLNEAFAVRIRGAALENIDGTIDKQGVAEAYQALAQSYKNRRWWNIVPDKATMTLNGLEQQVEGFYLCAAIAGMIAQYLPQQSFTNFPMTGIKSVIGSSNYFSSTQLDVIAAGGNYIVVQDVADGPVYSRMALTSDTTSIETRTDIITKVLDWGAKFIRTGLRNFIGRFNITQGLLDTLGSVLQGLIAFITDAGIWVGGSINNILQDETQPDRVLADVTVDPPYPCNYIRVTLAI